MVRLLVARMHEAYARGVRCEGMTSIYNDSREKRQASRSLENKLRRKCKKVGPIACRPPAQSLSEGYGHPSSTSTLRGLPMKCAQSWYSTGENGIWVPATNIKHRSEALDEGPFFDALRELVHWVCGGICTNGRRILPYFRHGPQKGSPLNFQEALQIRADAYSESPVHRKAKTLCAEFVPCWREQRERLLWKEKRPRDSDFFFCGNWLSNVGKVQAEYPFMTSIGVEYIFDVVLMTFVKGFVNPFILAAVEFELTSRLTPWKVAICKAQGFPLLSIDLRGVAEREITTEWLFNMLQLAPSSQKKGPQRNYLFMPRLLYPAYLDLSNFIRREQHYLLVFATEQNLVTLEKALALLRTSLDLNEERVQIERVSYSQEPQLELGSEGTLVEQYQSSFYLKVSLEVPMEKEGVIHLYHIGMAALLASHVECRVIYKYFDEAWNYPPTNPFWYHDAHKVCPKELSYPLNLLKEFFHNSKTGA